MGLDEVELFGKIGTTQMEVDRLCKRLQSKARRVHVVYEAGPCGYGMNRRLVGAGFDSMVCSPSLFPEKPGDRVKTNRAAAFNLVRVPSSTDLSPCQVL